MKYLTLLLTGCIILCGSTVFAREPLRLAATDFPPYEYSVGNRVDGITVRVVQEIFHRMNQPISITVLPWSRALIYLEKGTVDGVFELLKTDERERFADFSREVLMEETVSLFVLERSVISFSGNLSELSGFSFGVRKDFSYGPMFDNAVATGLIPNVKPSPKPGQLFIQLNTGIIDILIGDKYGTLYMYKHIQENNTIAYPYQRIKRLSPDVQTTPSYIAFSKKGSQVFIRDRFDTILQDMKASGDYTAIIRTWESALME